MYEGPLSFLLNVVVAGGGAATLAFLAFKFLGKSLVNNWFERQRENYRQERAEELQRYKAEIDTLLSGALKMQEFQHRILPEIWNLLINARMRVRELARPLFDDQDLDSMSESELEEFFNTTLLSEAQMEKIRKSEKKLDAYRIELYPMRVREADKACMTLQDTILKNKIFLPLELTSAFADKLELLVEIVDEYANTTVPMERKMELWNQQCRIGKKIDELGTILHDRFVELGKIRS